MSTRHFIVVIGAGFSGLAMGIALKKAGIDDFVIVEAKSTLGGTWRENTYPGCACDIPSHLYSYSFEPNPRWSRDYSPQAEILAYLEHCADKYRVRPHILFDTEVAGTERDEASGVWRLSCRDGRVLEAAIVIAGTGPFSRPSIPRVPGLERFRGATFHSAEWNHDYPLSGKRVAAIGTGASAIQFVPVLAQSVERLHVFQRTPPWVLPRADKRFRASTQRAFARVPLLQRSLRDAIYWMAELRGAGFVIDPRINKLGEWMARRHLARAIQDPALRAQLTPDYALGCKRVLFSDEYYPALTRPNVEVVPSALTEVREHSVVAADGTEREVDAIVFGTGFDILTTLVGGPVIGEGGIDLDEAWKRGAEAYLGLAVAGFPNFFVLLGPNTGLGHNSMVFMIEAQVHYLMQCIARIRSQGLRSLEVRAPAQRRFNDELDRRMPRTVWSTGCASWYLDSRGKNVTLWPGFTFEYWLRTRRVREADFSATPALRSRAS